MAENTASPTSGTGSGLSPLASYMPILDWGRRYDRTTLTNDVVAAVIVTIMLIPQSLAYALLAGLPPEMGLYASILPIMAYAVFGTSRALAVGPVAVVSLMTAAAIGRLGFSDPAQIALAAVTLALLSGVVLMALGVLQLGFLANFLSHPVIAGFITASGVIIAASQMKHILGVRVSGHNLLDLAPALLMSLGDTNLPTLVIGVSAMAFLFWARKGLKPLLRAQGLSPRAADLTAKSGPVAAVIVTTAATALFGLNEAGVAIVGGIPQGLPPLTAPSFDLDTLALLIGPAILISVIGFVESVSVAQTFAAKKKQRIDPNQEMIGLGAANMAAAFTGGYPVTGGFSRSVVSFEAGAETPAAGAFTAVGIGIATIFLTPLLYFLPKATLAATIIVAVLTLVDFSILRQTWRYSKADFAAVAATILLTLGLGVEVGVSAGVGVSLALFLYRSSRPHIAEVGQVPGTEHFRNIRRHEVITAPDILTLRVDGDLFFANARYLEDYVNDRVAGAPETRHLILMCSAVNAIDSSALESLERINERLRSQDVTFHLSEVKGPVMDRLKRSHFLQDLSGLVFLTQFQAFQELTGRCAAPAEPASGQP